MTYFEASLDTTAEAATPSFGGQAVSCQSNDFSEHSCEEKRLTSKAIE
jgi:hypothetical protein